MLRDQADTRSPSLQHAFGPEPRQSEKKERELLASDTGASLELPEQLGVEQLRANLQASRLVPSNTVVDLHTQPVAAECLKSQSLPVPLDHDAYESWRKAFPCVLQHLDDIKVSLKGKRLAVFLDYDGTLTPIVSNPDEAVMSQEMRDVVRNLAQLFPTAIISGRGREKVENFVQLKELFYAGSHGMDIAGPSAFNGGSWSACVNSTFQPAANFRPLIDSVHKELCARLASIPGSSVEHNTFCVSAHFRNCEGDMWQDVVAAVEQVVAANPELCMTRGRKVVEVRPKVNWHKGTALDHLLGVLGLRGARDVVAVYIGDDHTDEDAFRTLKEAQQGFGVLVSTKVKDTTAARYTVRTPAEVQAFLQALVVWGRTEGNAWRHGATEGSLGWPPSPQSSGSGGSSAQGPALDTRASPSSSSSSTDSPGLPAGGGDGGVWQHAPTEATGNGGVCNPSPASGSSSSGASHQGPAG